MNTLCIEQVWIMALTQAKHIQLTRVALNMRGQVSERASKQTVENTKYLYWKHHEWLNTYLDDTRKDFQ